MDAATATVRVHVYEHAIVSVKTCVLFVSSEIRNTLKFKCSVWIRGWTSHQPFGNGKEERKSKRENSCRGVPFLKIMSLVCKSQMNRQMQTLVGHKVEDDDQEAGEAGRQATRASGGGDLDSLPGRGAALNTALPTSRLYFQNPLTRDLQIDFPVRILFSGVHNPLFHGVCLDFEEEDVTWQKRHS